LSIARATLTGIAYVQRRAAALDKLITAGARVAPSAELPVTSAHLESLRSAPPRVATLYEGLGAAQIPEGAVVARPVPVIPAILAIAPIPSLAAIVRQPPEPTRPAAIAARTTVAQIGGSGAMRRVAISEVLRASGNGTGLRRGPAPGDNRETRLAAGGSVFTNNAFASSQQKADFTRLAKAALLQTTRGSATARKTSLTSTDKAGVDVHAGTTHVWRLPVRDVAGKLPAVLVGGDQAVRISAFDKGGALLADVELGSLGRFDLPARTARVAITGLGRFGQKAPTTPVMAGITSREASGPRAIVGWQAESQLVQVGGSTLLARGAVVSLGSPLRTRREGRRVDQSLIQAGEALDNQIGVETILPASVTTIGVMLERKAGSTLPPEQELGLGVKGATLLDPVLVVGPSRALLLYDVQKPDRERGFINISLAHRPEWRVHGVFGMPDTAAHWASALSKDSFDQLVENGPITAHGKSRIAFLIES
jgi:hypothetical protein